jgi:hypothetical protein
MKGAVNFYLFRLQKTPAGSIIPLLIFVLSIVLHFIFRQKMPQAGGLDLQQACT